MLEESSVRVATSVKRKEEKRLAISLIMNDAPCDLLGIIVEFFSFRSFKKFTPPLLTEKELLDS